MSRQPVKNFGCRIQSKLLSTQSGITHETRGCSGAAPACDKTQQLELLHRSGTFDSQSTEELQPLCSAE